MSEPDFIVIRRRPDMPASGMPRDLEGRWYDLTLMPTGPPLHRWFGSYGPSATATPTDRFEFRDDGAVAQVWELSW